MGSHRRSTTAGSHRKRAHRTESATPAGRRSRTRVRVVTTGLAGALAASLIFGVSSAAQTPATIDATVGVDVETAAWTAKARQTADAAKALRRGLPANRVPSSSRTATAAPSSPSAAPGSSAPAPAPATTVPASPAPATSGGSAPVTGPTATTQAVGGAAATAVGLLDATSGGTQGALTSVKEVESLPTSGAPWKALLAAANTRSGSADLADQDSKHAAQTLAAALVFARTGDKAQRDHVVSVLRTLPSGSLSSARVLSVGRQLGGYALAADVVGYRDAAFVSWIADMRTRDLGNHGRWTTITGTSEDSANNWGTWAMATRIAISAYLGDAADLRRAATVFRGFTGDRSAYAGFRKSAGWNPTWACGGDAWVPINPASCGDKGGAFVEDISRSSGNAPSIDATGLMYSWEAMGGATLSARLLERAGYSDVWSWGDRALLRAAQWLKGHGGYPPPYTVTQHIPHMINSAYGVDLGPVSAAGYGRQFGFTDWLD